MHMNYHICHFFFLTSKEYKDEFMRLCSPEKRSIFKSIYEVEDEFCDRIEDADFYVAPFIDIHTDPSEHIAKYKNEINYAFKLERNCCIFGNRCQ